MAYSSGGLIQNTDFTQRSTDMNNIWGVGNAANGWGQSTTITANSSVSGTVAAAQWATLVARVGTAHQHIFNNTTNVPAQPAAGGVITFLSTLDTALYTDVIGNKLTTYTTGTATSANYDNATTWFTSANREVSVTFNGGADAARYFFNAGGRIQLSADIVGYSTTGTAPTKSTDWHNLLSAGGATCTFYATSFNRGGTGYTQNTYNTGLGYYSLTTAYQTLLQLTSTTAAGGYTSNYFQFNVKSNGTIGANGDKGTVLTFQCSMVDGSPDTANAAGGQSYNDGVIGTTRFTVSVVPPETTYIANTWSTQTLAQVTNTQA
jgi:hypothetical protein